MWYCAHTNISAHKNDATELTNNRNVTDIQCAVNRWWPFWVRIRAITRQFTRSVKLCSLNYKNVDRRLQMLDKDYKIPERGKPSIFVGERQSSALGLLKNSSISQVINKSLHKLRGLIISVSYPQPTGPYSNFSLLQPPSMETMVAIVGMPLQTVTAASPSQIPQFFISQIETSITTGLTASQAVQVLEDRRLTLSMPQLHWKLQTKQQKKDKVNVPSPESTAPSSGDVTMAT